MFQLVAIGRKIIHLLCAGSLEELSAIAESLEVVWIDGEACQLDVW